MKKINIVLIILFLGLIFNCKAQERQANIATEIIGTWISEDDAKVKLVFNTDGTYTSYYDNEPTAVFNYSITDKCGDEYDINSWFLKAIDRDDNDEYCYELYGANSQPGGILSMRSMLSGKIFVYNKS
ncbi:hypothetical protein [Hyunsoonleella ulvae]|uniref:hypothetical protein n=1 Tax=Hyunsoonleella ulvae TaxID=2799948 RepID=UPI0019395D55|nr:hypothetical protein [Hyunsoonleella ulvae]